METVATTLGAILGDARILAAATVVLICVLVALSSYVHLHGVEVLLVILITAGGSLLIVDLFGPVEGKIGTGTIGDLFAGLVTVIGAPLIWVEYGLKGRENRLKAFWDAERSYVTDKEMTATALLIECIPYEIDRGPNPIMTLFDREMAGTDFSRTTEELELNRRVDTFLTYLNDMCQMREHGWIGKKEFDHGCWPYYAAVVNESWSARSK